MNQFQVRITEDFNDTYQQFMELTDKQHINRSSLIRSWISGYVKEQEQQKEQQQE